MLIRHEPKSYCSPKASNHLIGLPKSPVVADLKHTLLGLAAMLHKHGDRNGITTPSLFRCGRRNRESEPGGKIQAAHRSVHPAKPCFSMGFLTGHELTWMPEALRILRDELPNIDVMISSQYSPLLAEGLSKGKIDAAFLRKERAMPDLAFR